ncbi:hypothetical protein V8U11_01145 [Pseudomonas chlororaphis]|uniref:hypothetical protein n=1 Tax=Pseudomonas chlororaphis TaxID=587753 RepID=UPI000F5709D0|nr:hypothetical protein [Pseudomonas chlororaphis]
MNRATLQVTIVRVEIPVADRGYTPNKKDKANPLYNDNMNRAEVKLDSAGRPFTALPTKMRL